MKYKILYLFILNSIMISFLSGCDNKENISKINSYNKNIKTDSKTSFLFWCKRNEISCINFKLLNSDLIKYDKLKKDFDKIDGFYSFKLDNNNQNIIITYNNTKSKLMNYKNILIKNKILIK